MMMRSIGRVTGAALALALGGCATVGRVAGPQTAAPSRPLIQSITYATTPCHGRCPVYSVTVDANGSGVFTGTRETAVTGERRFSITPVQAARFFDGLQPYRSTGEVLLNGPQSCRDYVSDLPSADVKWTGARGSNHLLYDYGCDRDEHRALADALRAAPRMLPIAGLIGTR